MDPPDEDRDVTGEGPETDEESRAPARPVDRWRRNTASGALAAALARGLQQVFDPEKKDTIGIEQEAPTRPVDPEKFELHFDPLSSRGTSVVVHPPPPDEAQPDES